MGRRPPIVSNVEEIHGGLSNGMYSFTLQEGEGASAGGESLVLRVGHGEPQIAREFGVLRHLQATAVPVPAVWDVAEDALGWNFGIMERVDGVSLWEALDGAGHAATTELLKAFFGVLAEIHTTDWQGLGLDSLGVPDDEYGYVDALLAEYRREVGELGTRALDPVLDWMEANRRPSEAYALLHGDYHGGNVIADGGRIAAVVDWEGASIGDAASDLSWTPLLWRAFGAPDGAGDDVAGRALEYYREVAGRDPVNVEFYLAARAVRLLLYMMRTTSHAAGGGARKPGAEIMLLETPPLRCADVLREQTGVDVSSAVAAALDEMRGRHHTA